MGRLLSFSLRTALTALALLVPIHVIAAPSTWVSGVGNDVGTCTITAPCRTFAYAVPRTDDNGTINVLSAGSFGPVHLKRPLSIMANGVEARIESTLDCGGFAAAICIFASASSTVTLTGLTVDLPAASTAYGVWVRSGGGVHINRCRISDASGGISFQPVSASKLHISDCRMVNVGSGVVTNGDSAAIQRVDIEGLHVEDGGYGLILQSYAAQMTVSVRDSTFVANRSAGIFAWAAGGAGRTLNLALDRVGISGNPSGLVYYGAGTTIRMNDTTITGNTTGISRSGNTGILQSYGTNRLKGNGTDGVAPTPIPLQ